MCGLVGMAGEIKEGHKEVFRTLLLLNTSRGWDSTGVLKVPVKQVDVPTITKRLGTPYELFMSNVHYDHKGLIFGDVKVLLGHNRYATMGGVDIDGAHPFRFGNIIGAHNGTLRDWSDLSGFAKHSIDSKAIFQTILERGIEDTWKSFTGAAALSWWDEGKQQLNLIRNNERPLSLAFANDGSLILWASESWMIEAALKCKGGKDIKLDVINGIDSNPFNLKPHTLHTFTLKDTRPVLEPCRELEPMVEVSSVVGFWGNTRPAHKSKSSNASRSINLGWGKGFARAGKELIGTTFKILSAVFKQSDTIGLSYTVTGITNNKDLVRLYPRTYGEWVEWKEMAEDPGMRDNVYEITSRPRIEAKNGGRVTYRISTDGVELKDGFEYISYIDHTGKACGRKEAEEDLKEYGNNSCCCCDKSLTVDDEYTYVYYGYAALCKDCDSNEKLKDTMGIY